MSIIAIVVPPLTGHVNPAVSVAAELRERGHRVVWFAHQSVVGHLLPTDAEVISLREEFSTQLEAEIRDKARRVRGMEALKFLWEEFLIPLAHGMLPELRSGIRALKPDCIVVDQQALAGALVARETGIPWVTFSTTSASLINPFELLPQVQEWVVEQLDGIQREWDLPPVERPDYSPHGIVAFSTRALVGDAGVPPGTVFVGPSISSREEADDFPLHELEGKNAVLVSVGTVNQERSRRFFEAAAAGLAGWDGPVVAVAPLELLESWPSNFIVRSRIPQLRLLPHLRAAITHGGHNTVAECLYFGIPLVVAPIKDDQPVVAGQVVAAGAGIRIHFGRVTPEGIESALRRVVDEPSFKESARRIRVSFREAGGEQRAADEVERCL